MTTITVVEYDGELLFEIAGLKFDALQAYHELEGGNLDVIRNGVLLDQAVVGYVGPLRCFRDFKKLYSETYSDWNETAHKYQVRAADFELGDELILNLAVSDSDFADFLRDNSLWMASFEKIMDQTEDSISMGELEVLMEEEMDASVQQVLGAEVIRFIHS